MESSLNVTLLCSVLVGVLLAQQPAPSPSITIGCPCPTTDGVTGRKDLVPDSATAIRVAEAILVGVYGEKNGHSLRPIAASLSDGVWTVERHCKKGWGVGDNPTVKLLKLNGQILSMTSRYLK